MRLIGINGFKTSGKDTAFKLLQEEFPDLNIQRAAFADSLKEAAAAALGRAFGVEEGSEYDAIEIMDAAKERWTITLSEPRQDDEYEQLVFDTFTGRQYLQWFGQGMREIFGDSFWVDQVLPYPGFVFGTMAEECAAMAAEEGFWANHYPGADVVCVTDVRYPNEAQRILELKGEVWEIERPGLESDGHSSEIPLERNLVDITILNDGDLAQLKSRVLGAFSAKVSA